MHANRFFQPCEDQPALGKERILKRATRDARPTLTSLCKGFCVVREPPICGEIGIFGVLDVRAQAFHGGVVLALRPGERMTA